MYRSDSDDLDNTQEFRYSTDSYSEADDADDTDDVLIVHKPRGESQYHPLNIPEIFGQIMSYLELSDVLTCTRVCWKWLYAMDDYIWRHTFYTTFVAKPLQLPTQYQVRITLLYDLKCGEDKRCKDQITWLERTPWKISLMKLYMYLKQTDICDGMSPYFKI
jgi:hypothetical protein